jgi:SsrA-binding protein
MSRNKSKTPNDVPVLATHRRARHEYHIIERLETGLELRGTEVKSIRAGEVSLGECFARIEGGQLVLEGMHIQPYRHGNVYNHEPTRTRRLLAHRAEIDRLAGFVSLKGYALIPLRLLLRRGRVKLDLGVCRGKQQADKRETLRRRTAEREAERAMAAARKPG